MNSTITPDQIKAISSAVRALETERLGTKLPHNSLLNTITQTLGLGNDFRAFQVKSAKDAEAAKPKFEASYITFAFPTESSLELVEMMDLDFAESLEDFFKERGFAADFFQTANGWAQLNARTTDPTLGDEHLEKLIEDCKAYILQGVKDKRVFADLKGWSRHVAPYPQGTYKQRLNDCLPWKYAYFHKEFSNDRELLLDFMYDENKQVSTVVLREGEWKAAEAADMSMEEMTFLIACDEFPEGYTEADISGLQILYSPERQILAE